MECKPQCMAIKMLIIGGVIILSRIYTTWDIWVVIGSLMLLKGLCLFIMPICGCNKKKK